MKKGLITLCLILISLVARAGKADPTPFEVTQPDGTKLMVILRGDEHFSWMTTLDGALVMQTANGYYIAKIDRAGSLMPTKQLAHNINVRTKAERKLVKAQNQNLFFDAANKAIKARRALPIGTTTPAYFPHSGNPKVLTILVQFSDSTFHISNPKKSFDQYLNKEGELKDFGAYENRNYGSVRQYFKDMSNGQFTPQFDLVGPITLAKPLSYYGKDSGNVKDVYASDMVREACNAVKDSVNFADYDSNGDGIADLVYIVYAGYSQAIGGNEANDLWPKSSWISDGTTIDGVSIRRYGISNELNYTRKLKKKDGSIRRAINGIGLFCHEFSHTMGLPDFYPYTASARVDNQTMEYWDLMDGGEYTDAGYTPTPYTPWEKEVMGWIKVDTLTQNTGKVTLAHDQAYKVLTENAKEYLMFHNIQNKGWYTKLYKECGHGMLVYRINYEKSAVNMADHVNDIAGKPGMTIVPADGILVTSYNNKYTQKDYVANHAGDPFPGTSNVDSLTSVKMNYHTFASKPIYNITEDTEKGEVSFTFEKVLTGIEAHPIVNIKPEADNRIYTIDGRFVGYDRKNLPQGIYIQNKEKFVK